MQATKRAVLAGIGLCVVAACAPSAPPAVDAVADEAAMRTGSKAWIDAYNEGDASKIVALYADDGVLMPPNAPLAMGREAMRKVITADIARSKANGTSFALGEDSTAASGNLGWHSGTYKETGAGGATVGTGKYLELWRKADGKWLIIRDIWNEDAPATAAPATLTK